MKITSRTASSIIALIIFNRCSELLLKGFIFSGNCLLRNQAVPHENVKARRFSWDRTIVIWQLSNFFSLNNEFYRLQVLVVEETIQSTFPVVSLILSVTLHFEIHNLRLPKCFKTHSCCLNDVS